jgi:hypothetical protein
MGGGTADLLMAEIFSFVIVYFVLHVYEVFGYGRTWVGIMGGIPLLCFAWFWGILGRRL